MSSGWGEQKCLAGGEGRKLGWRDVVVDIYLGFELMGLHRWAESMAGLELGSFS